jgi:ferritin-like metal-binding protein YciE
MALLASNVESFRELYVDQLRDLYDAEEQILEALPKMIEKTSTSDLRQALTEHLAITRRQKDRLDRIFDGMGQPHDANKCKGIRGIISEGEELLDRMKEPAVRDAGIIASAQRVEHYEIAGYGTARAFAEFLGNNEDARLLQQTLEEEREADEKLTELAMNHQNPEATRVGRN